MSNYHLAQVNVAVAIAEMDSPDMHGFVSRLDEINALADHAKGFVWRLQSEAGNSTSFRVFDDDKLLINMSLWATVEDLKHFVYRTAHVELIQDREAWFAKLADAHQALWWVAVGHIPDAAEGRDKILQLRSEGPSASVFSMAKPFPSPG